MKNLTLKLTKVMSAVGRIKKNGFNSFHNYAYVTEADILEALRGELEKEHVFIFNSVESITKENDLTTVVVNNIIVDGDSGENITVKSVGVGQDKGDKGVYKAITGATKYFLMKNFLIPTGDDPEASDENGKSTAAKHIAKPIENKTTPHKKVTFSKKTVTTPTVETGDEL